tara:strand:- start:535 stop:1197 length:663 start_codon:yes stop_codon:yes gene_type:complete
MKAIENIKAQVASLEKRKHEHETTACREMNAAGLHKAAGRQPAALNALRRYKKVKGHATTISGMIGTLTDHMHSLEQKVMSSGTMNVMRQSVKTLSENAMDVEDVDNFMIYSEEAHQDMRHVTESMASAGDTCSDEDLLALLDTAAVPHADADAAAGLPVGTDPTEDERFESELELELTELMLPPVPQHTPGKTPASLTASPPEYAVRPLPVEASAQLIL